MSQQYSNPKRASDPYALPDVEVFYLSKADARANASIAEENHDDDAPLTEYGWYWQSCFPGCLPDSDPMGPYETEAEAIAAAQDDAAEEEN